MRRHVCLPDSSAEISPIESNLLGARMVSLKWKDSIAVKDKYIFLLVK